MAELDGPETFEEFKKQQIEKEEAGPSKIKIAEREEGKPSNEISLAYTEGSPKELSSKDRKKITMEIN
jgi:hypothetical protein